MSGIDVDLAVLAATSADLAGAGDRLEGLAGSTPAGVDAGPMSAVIASMLAQVVDSAGNVSAVLAGASELVADCRDYYRRADADADASLDQIQDAVR